MDWNDLRFVLAIARAQTLSGAAASLGVTHTTVSRRLKSLQQSLGTQLFQKTAEGFVLTAAGHDAMAVAERVEGEVFGLESRVHGQDVALKGRLRISTMDFLLGAFADAFKSFQQAYPGVSVTMVASDENVSLPRREADVVLRLSNAPPPYLHGVRLGRIVFAPYVSRRLADAAPEGAGMSDFPWIGWDERHDSREMDAWLERHAPEAKIHMRLGGTALAVREAVLAGLGVHYLAYFDSESDPRLKRIGPIDPNFGRDLWLLTLPELRTNARVRAIMEHLTKALRPYRGAMAGEEPPGPYRTSASESARPA